MKDKIQVESVLLSDIKENPLNADIFDKIGDDKKTALRDYIVKEGLLK